MSTENLLVVSVIPEGDPTAQTAIQKLKRSVTDIEAVYAYERNFRLLCRL